MSSSESDSDSSTGSIHIDFDDIENYELEVEPVEDSSSTTKGTEARPSCEKNINITDSAVFKPYDCEPIADEEWVERYKEHKENENIHLTALQERLDGVIPTSHWCKCDNCHVELLQNVYEVQCCQEIHKCTTALCSAEVLQDVEFPPMCITLHPGFRVNCLEKWTLRLAASKYKTKDRRKYYQRGTEEKFLRSVSYRQFSQLVFGTLGKLRIALPACAYHSIRTMFKVKGDHLTGFEEESSD